MATSLPLDESAFVTLDGSGNGALKIGPLYTAQTWIPTMISVTTSTNVKEAVFKCYRGNTVGPSNFLDGTYTPSNDSSTLQGIRLNPGESILCVWTGGDVGAIASVTLTGTKEIP